MTHPRAMIAGLVIWLMSLCGAHGADIPAILLVEIPSEGLSTRVDRSLLERSPHVTELVTSTPWGGGVQRFTGVPLLRLPDLANVEATDTVILTALNDYSIELPPQWREKAFLAWARDGTYLQPDDKGCFWVLFDFDSMSEPAVKEVQSLAIWQLFRIDVLAR